MSPASPGKSSWPELTWSFNQALRVLEHEASPEYPGFGLSTAFPRDPASLGHAPHLYSRARAFAAVTPRPDGRPHLDVHSPGLLWANGPMPAFYTRHILRRIAAGDTAPAAFLNLLQARLLALRYRAWAGARLLPTWENARRTRAPFAFAAYWRALGGGPVPGRGSDGLPLFARQLLLFSGRWRSATDLRRLVEEWLGCPARVQPLRLKRVDNLSAPAAAAGSLFIGDWMANASTHFHLEVGPLPDTRLRELLPGTPRFLALCALIRRYLRGSLSWSFSVQLDSAGPRPWTLGDPEYLGWTTWTSPAPGAPASILIQEDIQ